LALEQSDVEDTLPFDLHCGNRLVLEIALTSEITVALPTDLRYGNDPGYSQTTK